MTLWDRIKTALRREAADVKEGMAHVGRTLDEELARKERELNATPAERFDMILEDIEESDSRLAELESQLHDSPSAPEPRLRRQPIHQLLEASDVSSSPLLDDALAAVTVTFEPIDSAEHTHVVAISRAADVAAVADGVAEHTLVTSSVATPAGTIHVRADNLHVEDVRLLAAAALAEQPPTG